MWLGGWEGETVEGLELLYTGFEVTHVAYCTMYRHHPSVSSPAPVIQLGS